MKPPAAIDRYLQERKARAVASTPRRLDHVPGTSTTSIDHIAG